MAEDWVTRTDRWQDTAADAQYLALLLQAHPEFFTQAFRDYVNDRHAKAEDMRRELNGG